MGFYDRRLFAAAGFNNIGIDGSLYQKVNGADLFRFLFKNTDKFFTDNLPLAFGFGYSGKFF